METTFTQKHKLLVFLTLLFASRHIPCNTPSSLKASMAKRKVALVRKNEFSPCAQLLQQVTLFKSKYCYKKTHTQVLRTTHMVLTSSRKPSFYKEKEGQLTLFINMNQWKTFEFLN